VKRDYDRDRDERPLRRKDRGSIDKENTSRKRNVKKDLQEYVDNINSGEYDDDFDDDFEE
jgi:hypothetical protein